MSKDVNKLLAVIKKAEVRKQGKESNAKRDLKRAEFKKTLRLLEANRGFVSQHKIPAMLKLQFHLIGRTDDVSNIESKDLREGEEFPDFTLQTKVAWSKNVNEERDCPPQIILGANDPDFCTLLGLASYMESRFTASWGNARFLFGETNADDEPMRTNDNCGNHLKRTWKSDEFKAMAELVRGSIGTHSIRKFAVTWAGEHGCSDPEVETRGCWKGSKNGRIVNLCIKDVPHADGKVCVF